MTKLAVTPAVDANADFPPPTLHVELSNDARQVGSLYRRPALPPLFVYRSDAEPQSAVSLTMPVNEGATYEAPKPQAVHPIFEMNLPEGEMRQVLEKTFARHFPAWDDCALLGVIGRSMIGRLTIHPALDGEREKATPPPPLLLKDLLALKNSRGLFSSLLERYAAYAGVSGVQPKFLVRDEATARADDPTLSDGPTARRMTATGTTHIVKSADLERFPGLVANEFLCLKAAREAGLEVAEATLSEDGTLLAVKRFDLAVNNPGDAPAAPAYLGFEDLCVLAGLRTHDKYTGSHEQMAKIIRAAAGVEAGASLAQFFRAVVFTVAIRNCDAHRKNFGMLYSDPTQPARLAPTYDVLTTCVYGDDNMLALTLAGTKRWPDRKRLLHFGLNSCGLTMARATLIVEEVAAAVSRCRREWLLAGRGEENAVRHLPADLRASIADAWADGLSSLMGDPKVRTTGAKGPPKAFS
jgi:serine/threonine-protein kinase HipA